MPAVLPGIFIKMRQFLITVVFFISGCAGNDKNGDGENPVVSRNIDGEALFKTNCSNCHKPDKEFTGPILKGALQRWGGDKKAMFSFIRNPAESIIKNAYAKKVFDKWNKISMPAFRFTDSELDAMMKYCETSDYYSKRNN